MRKPVFAQVHRFRDDVAICVGGETVYLTPAEATRLTKVINRVAKSCRTESFANSTCGTASFQFGEGN